MKVYAGIDVGHTTGVSVVAYFESSQRTVVYMANSYAVNQLNKMYSDLWDAIHQYKPDGVLVEYPEVTRHMTYNPGVLKNVVSIVKDMLKNVPKVREVRPTDWKQTPAVGKEINCGQTLNTRHELDAARMCYWAAIYNTKNV